MKILSLLALIALCVACGNNGTVKNKPEESSLLRESTVSPDSLENQFSKTNSKNLHQYFPEKYEEKVIDTILATESGFRIFMKLKTLMNSDVSFTYDIDGRRETHHYREYSVEVIVFNSGKQVFKKTFLKNSFTETNDREYLRQATILNAWIDAFDSEKKEAAMSLVICVPETDWSYRYQIKVGENGRYSYELMEDEE